LIPPFFKSEFLIQFSRVFRNSFFPGQVWRNALPWTSLQPQNSVVLASTNADFAKQKVEPSNESSQPQPAATSALSMS
jgi:hypothetical protein